MNAQSIAELGCGIVLATIIFGGVFGAWFNRLPWWTKLIVVLSWAAVFVGLVILERRLLP